MIRVYSDAAVKGNPGKAGIGILVVTNDNQHQIAQPLKGDWNNHQAEFQALIFGLKWLIDHNLTDQLTFCYTDSQIVAQSIDKQYAKDTHFSHYLSEILSLMASFAYISVEWIPESQNKGADNLAQQALKKASTLS